VADRLEPIAAWQVVLLTLQALQVAFLWLHDWIPLGRLNDVAAARGADTRRLIRTTMIQSIPFSIVLWFSARYFDHPYPAWLRIWLWISYGLLFLGEIRPRISWRRRITRHRAQRSSLMQQPPLRQVHSGQSRAYRCAAVPCRGSPATAHSCMVAG
jgi:hypothetical protein